MKTKKGGKERGDIRKDADGLKAESDRYRSAHLGAFATSEGRLLHRTIGLEGSEVLKKDLLGIDGVVGEGGKDASPRKGKGEECRTFLQMLLDKPERIGGYECVFKRIDGFPVVRILDGETGERLYDLFFYDRTTKSYIDLRQNDKKISVTVGEVDFARLRLKAVTIKVQDMDWNIRISSEEDVEGAPHAFYIGAGLSQRYFSEFREKLASLLKELSKANPAARTESDGESPDGSSE